MITTEQKQTNHIKIIFTLVGVVILTYLATNSIAQNRFTETELFTRDQIAHQQTILAAIAETTARNGADSVTEAIVRDCPISERSKFDDLLGRLNEGLSRAQLVELERLFGRCGSFYSERKLVMVSRLAREIEVFDSYVQQLALIEGDGVIVDYKVEKWKELSQEETKQSLKFAELVTKQDQIISTLLDGKSASSPEILEILNEVQQIQETLIVANKQASAIRTELISL